MESIQRLAAEKTAPEPPPRRRMPTERRSLTHKFSVNGHEGYLTAGLYEDGTVGNLFITGRHEQTPYRATRDSATITIMEKDAMSTVIVSEGERQLVYRIVDGEAGDERLTIERVDEPTFDEVLADERSRRMTPEEFETHFGQLPLTANE